MKSQRRAGAAQDEEREQTRRALVALLVPLFFVAMFSLCIIGTYHKPHPNGIKVGVVGPAGLTAPLRTQLEQRAGEAFDITPVDSIDDAVHDVRNRDLDAAFVPTADPARPATLVVGTANGRIVAVAVETLARAVTTTQGAQLDVRDVRPLGSGDEIGLGIFLFMIICTIGGYLAATVLDTAAPELGTGRRSAMLGGVAIAVPVIAYLIAGLGFSTYTGSTGTILAFVGVGMLYTLVVVMVTRLFQVVLGLAAIFVSLTIFVFLNIPSLGATYTAPVLPSFWRFLNEFWVGADIVNAERSILYYGGSDLATYLLRFLVWTAATVGFTIVLLVLSRTRVHRRARSSAPSTALPAGVHARRFGASSPS